MFTISLVHNLHDANYFELRVPGGAELGKMSFTIEFVYENYKF